MTSIISFEMDFTVELKIEREIWENRKTYLDIQKLKFFKFLNLFYLKIFSFSFSAELLNYSI